MNAWVCTDCPYEEGGEYFAAFNVAFIIDDPEVTYDSIFSTNWPPTSCYIQGGALLGGCEGPACR